MCLCLLLLAGAAQAAPAESELWARASQFMKAEAYAEALPILENLVSTKPRNKHYRFNLALALYQLERDGRARFHLEQVRGAGLNPNETGLVNTVIGRIDARRVWSGYFSFNLRPESNGTKQTEDRLVVVGGLPFTLNDTAVGKPTVSSIVSTGFTYAPTLRKGLKLELSLGALIKHNTEVAVRDYQISGRAGLGFAPDPLQYWSGGVLVGKRWTADVPYSETLGGYLSHARRVGQAGTLSFSSEVSRAFRRQGRADIDRTFLSVSYRFAINGNAQLSFTAFGEKNDTEQLNLKGFRRGLSATALYAFDGGLITSLTARAEADNRDGVNQLFGVQREDRKLAVDLRVYHRDFRIGSFAPEVQFGVERNTSNIPLADYTNRYISLGLTRKF